MILLIVKILIKISLSVSWPVRIFKYLSPLSISIQIPSCWQQKTRECRLCMEISAKANCAPDNDGKCESFDKQTNRKIEVKVLNTSI